MWKKTLTSILMLGFTTVVTAEPIVIYNSGDTQPMQFYFKPLQFQYASTNNINFNISGLPVSTPSMTPGTVIARQINKPHLTQPFFIVGADMFSYAWLNKHRENLKLANAIGIAVNVKTQAQLDQLVKLSGGLSVNPVPGEVIAKQLSLTHYPVLISKSRIEQ